MKSRTARLVFAVCVLTVVMLAVPMCAGASWDPWMSTRLIAYDGPLDPVPDSRSMPFVDGKWIVWQEAVDSDPSDKNIFAYDTSTRARKEVWGAAGTQAVGGISGDWVVLSGDQSGTWDVYAFNLATNTRRTIASGPGDQSAPDISGTKIVYQDGEDVCVYDLATSIVTTLPLGDGVQSEPEISGDRVVYAQSLDIYVFDRRSGGITRLTASSLEDRLPAIDGTLVTWMRSSGADRTIYCRDLTSAEVQTIATYTGSGGAAQVEGGRIVYSQEDGGESSVWIYDPSLRLGTALTDGPSDLSPVIDGNNIAYASNFTALGGDITWGRLAGPTLPAQALAPIVGYGAPSTIAGSLVENGIPLGGMTVTIDGSSDGGHTWTPVGSTTTGASGAYAFPTGANNTRTYYRARYGGATRRITVSDVIDHFSAESSPVLVVPEAYLSKPSGPAHKTHNTTFTSAGYLKPLHAAGTQPVVIKCYKKSGSHWNLKKTYKATISTYDSTKCKYKASVKLPTMGSWRIRAYYPPSATNAPKYSSYRYITSR